MHDESKGKYFLKAIDFDNAALIGEDITFNLTGTPRFISPEVATQLMSTYKSNFHASKEIDIFALGLIIFELAIMVVVHFGNVKEYQLEIIMQSFNMLLN